jgi:hypothetical protein
MGPMPPRMPNTDWTKKGGLTRPRVDEMGERVEMADVVALELEARAVGRTSCRMFSMSWKVFEDEAVVRSAAR